jgi:Zn-dependent protease/predicted transcriptional regulator
MVACGHLVSVLGVNMRWSVPIGRVSGITLRLHVTFLLFLAFIGYGGFIEGGWSGAGWALAMLISIFACVVLHELGHSLVAQQLGVQVKSITLLPIGGVAGLRNIPEQPWHEIAITVAGPMVNVVIACLLLPFTGLPSHLLFIEMPHDMRGLLLTLAQSNIMLFLFNCIPAFPMDGGRLLRALLALVIPYRRATAVAAAIGQGLAIVFVLVGLKMSSLWLIIIGAFIFMAAEGEERMVRIRSLLHDLDVEEVMSRDFAVLSPDDPASRGTELIYQTGQDDFPVVENDHLVGIVTRPKLVEVMNAHGADAPVREAMNQDVFVVSPHEKVSRVYEEIIGDGNVSAVVMDDGKLVGVLSPENISRYLLVQSSIKPASHRRPAHLVARVSVPPRDPAHTPAPPPMI